MENWKKRPPLRKIELVELFCLAPTDILICYFQRHMSSSLERRSIDFACIYTKPWQAQSTQSKSETFSNRTNRLFFVLSVPSRERSHIPLHLGKFGKSSTQKCRLGWDMLVSRSIYISYILNHIFHKWIGCKPTWIYAFHICSLCFLPKTKFHLLTELGCKCFHFIQAITSEK